MIVSHSKRFIFIKTRKTAGSSLQKALGYACAPGDVLISHPSLMPGWGSIPEAFEGVTPHVGRDFIAEHFPREWSEYAKVTVERHPLEKVVSLYWWEMREQREPLSFLRWFDSIADEDLTDFDRYGDADGRLLVDRVILVENIEEDYRRCCRALDLAEMPLGREKADIRPRGDVAQTHFTGEALERMRRVFRRECDAFGYGIPG